MTIQMLQVPPIGTNCYLLKDDETGLGAIIDPGGAAEAIRNAAEKMEMTPALILLTHAHYDHTGAVVQLREFYPNITVYLHPNDAARTKDPAALMPDIGVTADYDEGSEIPLGSLTIRVLHTPGHTPGCVTLAADNVLFTGDTLFRGSCGRTDLPGGNTREILASLKRLAELSGDYQVLPGHEGRSTLEAERRSNYYMLQATEQ